MGGGGGKGLKILRARWHSGTKVIGAGRRERRGEGGMQLQVAKTQELEKQVPGSLQG